MSTLKELSEAIAQKSKVVSTIFEEAGPDLDFTKVKCLGEGDSKAKVEKIQALNKELTELKGSYDALKAIETQRRVAQDINAELNARGAMTFPGKGSQEPVRKSIGQLIMEQKDKIPGASQGSLELKGVELKTLFETTAGWATQDIRIPRVELLPARALVVSDYLPQIPTTQAAVVYMEETTATFNALEKGEGLLYAESAFALTQRTETVRKVTTSLPVTDEQLDDVPAAEAYINQRIGYDIRRRLDLQILEGLGTGVLLKGTLNVVGIQSQALWTDPVPDAIYKCFDLIRTNGFAEPDVLFINPNDWQPVRLLRTADGIYIFGSPQDVGAKTIWGVTVVQTTAVTENTALCGAYQGFASLYVRKGLEVSWGWTGTQFTEGERTLRADIRVAVVHFRPKAFGKITGI